MSNQELKPCPFCGSKDLIIETFGKQKLAVYCDSCCTDGPLSETKAAATEAWNRRHQPATTQQPAEYHGGLGDK